MVIQNFGSDVRIWTFIKTIDCLADSTIHAMQVALSFVSAFEDIWRPRSQYTFGHLPGQLQ